MKIQTNKSNIYCPNLIVISYFILYIFFERVTINKAPDNVDQYTPNKTLFTKETLAMRYS